MNRRDFVLGATTASTAAPLRARAQTSTEAYRALLDRLGDPPGETSTEAGAARRRSAATRRAAALGGVDVGSLSPETRVLHAGVVEGARTEAAFRQLFPFGAATGASPYVIHPRAGAFTRADASAGEIDGETERVRADAARGVVLPRSLLEPTLARLASVGRSRSGEVAAALDRQSGALEGLRGRAPADPGVWRLPDGDAYYALALSLSAGGRVSPEDAHRRGVEVVRELHLRADALLRAQGMSRGSVTDRLQALARDPRHLYPATDAGKDQAVAEMNASLARARAALPRVVAQPPGAPLEVRRMSAAEETAGAAGRREAASATAMAGYVVDLIRIRDRPRWTLPSVVHHELLPGHLLQDLSAETGRSHPLLARYAPGYGEGWAIYAEGLADELGLFDDDPLGRLGYLHWMLFRMGRLVVDTGIHLRRWSRERAIRELRAIQGDPIAFISIEEDVDRMAMQPGAAAGQALAALAIERLRAESRRRLGGRFTLQGFHAAILSRGPVGAAGLTQAVALWEGKVRA